MKDEVLMTAIGKERYDLVSEYNLEAFYQVQNGNVIIPKDEFKEPISRYVLLLVKDNPDWILGHEDDYWYLTTLADIKGV